MAKTRKNDKSENKFLQIKQILGSMNNIVLDEATLQSMECSELLSRKEKYLELKSSYDKRYEEFCELAENLDLQQFTSDTETL